MRDRSQKTASYSVDVLLVTAMGSELAILLARNSTERERWALPWRIPQTGEPLDAAAGSSRSGCSWGVSHVDGADRCIRRRQAPPERGRCVRRLRGSRSSRDCVPPRGVYMVPDGGSPTALPQAAGDGRSRYPNHPKPARSCPRSLPPSPGDVHPERAPANVRAANG